MSSSDRPIITEEVVMPDSGLYDLMFIDRGFMRGGRYDSHRAPQDCRKPESLQNKCPVCGAPYYDFEPDEGESVDLQ